MDFTSQACGAIKIGNLLRADHYKKSIIAGEGLTCFCFRCTRKRFLLNEILMMFPLHEKEYSAVHCSEVRL